MGASRRKSSVLIAAESENTFKILKGIIGTQFSEVLQAATMAKTRQLLASGQIDVLVINTPLPDEAGVEAAINLAAHKQETSILLIVKQKSYAQVCYKTEGTGIFVMMRPLRREQFLEAARMLRTMQGRITGLLQSNEKLRRKLEDAGTISRAKCLLIEYQHMTENEAHHYLEAEAMDNALPKAEVARRVIFELEARYEPD